MDPGTCAAEAVSALAAIHMVIFPMSPPGGFFRRQKGIAHSVKEKSVIPVFTLYPLRHAQVDIHLISNSLKFCSDPTDITIMNQ